MSDDLVKRLRNPIGAMRPTLTDGREAADRIEELKAQRKKTYESLLTVTRINEELEVKLAKTKWQPIKSAPKDQHILLSWDE